MASSDTMTATPSSATTVATKEQKNPNDFAFNLGLNGCVAADNTAAAQNWQIATNSDYIALLTEIQATIMDIDNTALEAKVKEMNDETSKDKPNSNTVTQLSTEYSQMSSEYNAATELLTTEQNTKLQHNDTCGNNLTAFNNAIAAIISGLGLIVSLLNK